MGDVSENYVQVAADSVGKKLRVLKLEILQPDGTMATVNMQVASIANDMGQILDFDETAWKLRLLELIELQTQILMSLASSANGKS